MRGNRKIISIDNKSIEIKELRVKEIIEIVEDVKEQVEEKECNLFLNTDFTLIPLESDFIKVEIEGLQEKDFKVEGTKIKINEDIPSKEYKVILSYQKPLVKILEGYCNKYIGISFEEMKDFYPSEIEEILKAFESVNSPLLRTLSLAGISKESLISSLKTEIQEKQ